MTYKFTFGRFQRGEVGRRIQESIEEIGHRVIGS